MSENNVTNSRKELIKKLYDEAIAADDVPPKEDETDYVRHRVEIRDGEIKGLKVVNLPHKEFLYNEDNIRILASREEWESKNPGKTLNATDNVKEIESFLTENPTYGQETTEELKEDIKKPHYLKDPIMIDEDGVVWNGNRRLAVVRTLLSEDYEQRFEKVPTIVFPSLTYDEKRAIEGRLQIKKTFQQNYGTFDIRCDIRRARKNGEEWGKIQSRFGKYSENDLKVMLNEINGVDEILADINRPKDYTFASNMGSGRGTKSGIEIWRIPLAELKQKYKELVGEMVFNKETQKEEFNAATNPNPTKYNQTKIQWTQQLLNPLVSHDTIRIHQKVRKSDLARKEYESNDRVIKNYSELVTEKKQEGGVEILKAYSIEEVKKAVKNSGDASDMTGVTDPTEFSDKATDWLKKIKDDDIPQNNEAFKTSMNNVTAEAKRITDSKKFSAKK